METKRQAAIRSGVRNAAQTVYDKDMSREMAFALLSEYVQDGLNSAGFRNDIPTVRDMDFARSVWPL